MDPRRSKPSPPRGPRRLWVAITIGILILLALVLAGAMVFFHGEIGSMAQIGLALKAARAFAGRQVPALRKDFPFDPGVPPALDADLFARYCAARAKISRVIQPILSQVEELQRAGSANSRDPRVLIRSLGPVARNVKSTLAVTEEALRACSLSAELYRWITIQTWGQVALAARDGNSTAYGALESLCKEWGPALKLRPSDPGAAQAADAILRELGAEFAPRSPGVAWTVILDHWTSWETSRCACASDFAMIKYWSGFLAEIEKTGGAAKKQQTTP